MGSNNSLIVPEGDLDFFERQDENETNMMLAGMLSLISDNQKLNEGLQSQSWLKRMLNTVIGKNKATAQEIRQNHDKLNAYMAQAVGELYKRNKISSQIMVSLGLQISQIYDSHLELKEMLYELVGNLNQKIDEIDHYHTLMWKINEGFYGNEPSITRLLSIVSQIDRRMISDSEKMMLLKAKLSEKNLLIRGNKWRVNDFLSEISDCQGEELGVIYADLHLYNDIYSDLAINVIESWNMLPGDNRKIRDKAAILSGILREAAVDGLAEINIEDFYNARIALRKKSFDESTLIPETKRVAVMGSMGSGKTTLIKNLMVSNQLAGERGGGYTLYEDMGNNIEWYELDGFDPFVTSDIRRQAETLKRLQREPISAIIFCISSLAGTYRSEIELAKRIAEECHETPMAIVLTRCIKDDYMDLANAISRAVGNRWKIISVLAEGFKTFIRETGTNIAIDAFGVEDVSKFIFEGR